MTKKTNGQPDATNKGTIRRQNKQKGGEAETMQKATQPWHAEGQQRSAEQATNRHTSSETLRQEQNGEGTNTLLRAQQGTVGSGRELKEQKGEREREGRGLVPSYASCIGPTGALGKVHTLSIQDHAVERIAGMCQVALDSCQGYRFLLHALLCPIGPLRLLHLVVAGLFSRSSTRSGITSSCFNSNARNFKQKKVE